MLRMERVLSQLGGNAVEVLSGDSLDNGQGNAVKARAISGKLELVGGIS